MASVLMPRLKPTISGLVWEIGGDAADEEHPKDGLGAWFYGIWWRVMLDDVPGLRGLHITALELIEVGLGVVVTGPWLAATRRVLCILLRYVATMALLLGAFGGATMLLAGKHNVPGPPGIQEELASCCTMGDGAGRRLATKRPASSSSADEENPPACKKENPPACKRMCSKSYMKLASTRKDRTWSASHHSSQSGCLKRST